jgi:hypothetical protein
MVTRGGGAVREGWRWLASVRDWSADRRSQAVAAGAAILLLLAVAAILIGKATAPHPARPPRTGGESPGPAQASIPAAPDRPSVAAPPAAVPATTRSPAASQLAAINVSGASGSFTPADSTRTVPPGTSVTVRFDVERLGVRNGLFTFTIDDRACAGIPG